ncbi:MAG: lipid-A-disaccharide synthase-related protein [Cyanobacteria bacterium J06650_10]
MRLLSIVGAMSQINLLCISNGHGEDVIALRILTALRQQAPDIQLSALPISGTGSPYRNSNIDIIGTTQTLPSGGFLNRDPKQLARDVQGGLISLTRSQLAALKTWRTQFLKSPTSNPHILSVGDIVPLIFAHRTGLPYHFIGTAKSEYWIRSEQGQKKASVPSKSSSLFSKLEGWSGSVYLPWERWLMTRPNCNSVFVRDALTAQQLEKIGIPAQHEGNPMMDSLTPAGTLDPILTPLRTQTQNILTIALLPGSRPPEAYANWARILQTIPSLAAALPDHLIVLLGAIAPTLTLEKLPFPLALDNSPWTQVTLPLSFSTNSPDPTCLAYSCQNITLIPIQGAYKDCLHEANIAIATAGTATEQFVGLGKPALTLPGPGPQFTQTFATTQAKMLGPSIQILGNPKEAGSAIARLITNPERLQTIRTNGKQRMGDPGAAQRIAQKLLETMNTKEQ